VKKQIITIAGGPGSGKSTTAKEAARRLGYEHFSSGDLFRRLGEERGVNVRQANQTPGVTEELDRIVDAKLRELGVSGNQLVIDSRTAWHWIPDSFKVFLDLDFSVAAQRILDAMTEERLASEDIPRDRHKYALELRQRQKTESRRYEAIYNIDPYNPANFDLVIDTTANGVEKVADLVVEGFREWLKR
jgi:CMP/dCMP kinase